MAEKELKSIKFPGLEDVYKVPEGGSGSGGADGYSPVAKVEETADGAKITITDKTGTTEATVKNGKDGKDGTNGAPGKDGKDGTDGAPGKDGDNGLTPTIGDNGNWYLGTEDTGQPSRGASGAPGKDGAGMDITGAAAGQIAKISAVDENGVPTAWEPVGMPSGGGGGEKEWELLADITLAEDAASIIVTQTQSGESFSIHELAIFGNPVSDGTNKTLSIFPYKTSIGYGSDYLSFQNVLSATDGHDSYIAIYLQVLPECVFGRAQYNLYNNTLSYSIMASTGMRKENQVAYAYNGDPITAFAIGPWANGASGALRAGTKLKVYGR